MADRSNQTVENKPSYLPWLLLLWAGGVICALTPMALGVCSLARLQRQSLAVESGRLRNVLQHMLEKIALSRGVLLLTSGRRRMPMTWGVFRPVILLPAAAAEWPLARQRLVLLHEVAHIRRWDAATILVTRLVCACYWFNPLVWLVARRIAVEQEQACDDMVLSDGAGAPLYAEELLQIAAGHAGIGAEALVGVAMARSSTLEGRLLAILDEARNRRRLNRATVLAATLLLLVGLIPVAMMRTAQSSAAVGLEKAEHQPGLIAWWRAEDKRKDSAGEHHGGFPFGQRYVRGLAGQAFDFRRSHAIEHQLQRVSIPDNSRFELPEAMTLEAWVYPRRYQGIILIRGDDRGGYDAWHLDLMMEGNVNFSFNTAENEGAGIGAPIQLGQWQHIVATFHHGAMRLYINGAIVAEAETPHRPISKLDPRYNPALGIGNAGGKVYSMPFDGLIDEVKIYNRALTQAEVMESLKR